MPVVIGAKPESGFQDPIGLLIDCHRRVERFLSVLVRVGVQAQGGPLTAEQRTSLESALRYFREAAPKHTADEEESLFPRLWATGHPGLEGVLERVKALQGDHAKAEKAHAEVERLGQAWLANGTLSETDAARFRQLLAGLTELYRAHIAIEEREVFPAAAASIGQAQRDAMGKEMAARRGVPQDGRARRATPEP